jgi:cobalamin-dependent methionine synthase I
MIVIGERINATRKIIATAIEQRNVKLIQEEINIQLQSSIVDYLDVNCGLGRTDINKEVEDMKWLMNVVQEITDIPLMIDSPNYEVIETALKMYKNKSKPIINSITLEKQRYEKILPLVKEYDTSVVALTIDENGVPKKAIERVEIAKKIINLCKKYDIDEERIFFDFMVKPVAVEPDQTIEFLESIKTIKTLFPKVKTVCGASNISFGLPNRKLLNSVFLAIAISYGLDAAIIDPSDKKIVSAIYSAEALLGKDEYCMRYIDAYRENKIE